MSSVLAWIDVIEAPRSTAAYAFSSVERSGRRCELERLTPGLWLSQSGQPRRVECYMYRSEVRGIKSCGLGCCRHGWCCGNRGLCGDDGVDRQALFFLDGVLRHCGGTWQRRVMRMSTGEYDKRKGMLDKYPRRDPFPTCEMTAHRERQCGGLEDFARKRFPLTLTWAGQVLKYVPAIGFTNYSPAEGELSLFGKARTKINEPEQGRVLRPTRLEVGQDASCSTLLNASALQTGVLLTSLVREVYKTANGLSYTQLLDDAQE